MKYTADTYRRLAPIVMGVCVFTLTVMMGNPARAALADGLIAYWPLDDDAQDQIADSHGVPKPDGTTLTYVDSPFGLGKSVDLDGVNQYIEINAENEDVFDFGAPDNPTGFTITAWFRVDDFTKNWQALAAKGENNRWRIHRQDNLTNMTANGGAGDVNGGETDVTDGGLYHLALVSDVDGGAVRLYINGALEMAGGAPALENNGMPMMLGENPDASGRTWDGLIDDVGAWNRALTEEEVAEIYNGGLEGNSLADLTRPVFLIDFNTPESYAGVELIGDGEVRDTDGVDDSGYLKITDAQNSQRGIVIFPDLTGGQSIAGFNFSADFRVGGGTANPADGFSVSLVRPDDPLLADPRGAGFSDVITPGRDLPEEGSTTGLGIGFDTWKNEDPDVIGISVRLDDELIEQVAMSTNGDAEDETSLVTGPDADNLTWQPFSVSIDESGRLLVSWKGAVVVDRMVDFVPSPGQIVFGGRTGGANANHHVDNISLELIPASLASLGAFKGNKAGFRFVASDGKDSSIVRDSIVVTLNDADITDQVTLADEGGSIRGTYAFIPELEPDSTHDVVITAQTTTDDTLTVERQIVVPGSIVIGGGTWTTTHVHGGAEGLTFAADTTALKEALDTVTGDNIITAQTQYIHFHDNTAPPVFVEESRPYPLWDDDIPGSLGGGFGNREDFGIRSTGKFVLAQGGTIQFICNSDDGFLLLVDGVELGTAGDRGRGNTVMSAELTAGVHDLDFFHWERGGGAGVSVFIQRTPGEALPLNADDWQLIEALNPLDPPIADLPDTDTDGLPDLWEEVFFGNLDRDGTGDFDEDGLIDSDELANKVDPTAKDTDGDGLEDGPEVATHGSDPANADTDGDTLTDAAEVNDHGTDPAKADTDDDGAQDAVELAFETDPLDGGSTPDVVAAVLPGLWNAPTTWSDGLAPSADKDYVVLGGIVDTIVSGPADFAGNSLTILNSNLSVAHANTVSANLIVDNGMISSGGDNTLGGQVEFRGDSTINVGTDDSFSLDAGLSGTDGVSIVGDGELVLSGGGSTITGDVSIANTSVGLTSVNVLTGSGDGNLTLANGTLLVGAATSVCGDLLIKGNEFTLDLRSDITVKDLKGIDPITEGQIFSLQAGFPNATLSAGGLVGAGFGDTQAIGDGNVVLNDAVECSPPGCDDPEADSDSDGVSDCDELLTYGTDPNNVDTDGDGFEDGEEVAANTNPKNPDSDGDGLNDGDEDTGGTDPLAADTDGDGFLDGADDDPLDPNIPDISVNLVVHYDFNEGSGTAITNLGTGGDGTLTNAHAGAWVASGAPDGSGYLNFTQDGDTSADSQYVATGINASDLPVSGDVDYTMTAWARFDNTAPGGDSQDNMIFGQLDAGDGANVLHNGARGGAFHQGHWGNDITGGTVTVGEWQHVAYRYEAGVQSILVDGEVVVTDTKGALSIESEIVIGATRGEQDRDFSGDLDDVRIYDIALPDGAIRSIMGGGGPVTPAAGFSITSIVHNGADVTLTWPVEAGKTYSVEYSSNAQAWTEIANSLDTGTYSDTDAGRIDLPEGYYRVGEE